MCSSAKKIALSILVIFTILLLAACGENSSDDTHTNGKPQDSNKTEAAEFFSGVTFNDLTANYNGSRHKLEVCGNIPEGTEIEYQNNTAVNEGEYTATATLKNGKYTHILKAKLRVVEPTAAQVVTARANTVNNNEQGFDYQYKLTGTLSALGYDIGAIEGVYTCQFRQNMATGEYVFKRTTSGEMLIDSTKYAYGLGNQRIVVKVDDDGNVKNIYNETVDEHGEFFIHKPIEALVNHISADEIKKISISSDIPGYKYKAEINLKSDNKYINAILSAASMLDTTISLKGVEIPTLTNGLNLYFNYDEGDRIEDFYIAITLNIDFKGVKTPIAFSYQQTGKFGAITVPKDESFIVDSDDISSKVQLINDSLLELKNSEAYSINVNAINDFDPSWNILSIVDKYKATLFKNGDDFNHSYEFKAHHEDEGAETYKYTLGNVVGKDAGVYLVTRKGHNSVNPADASLNAYTQFEFLTAMTIIESANVDCVKVIEDGDDVAYKIYLNKHSVIGIQQKILNIINSNNADGVVKVNNHLNTEEYFLENAVIEVKYEKNQLALIKCETDIRYIPIGGEYTEYNVALKNTIEIIINKSIENARNYTAPNSTGTVLGIGSFTYYIE